MKINKEENLWKYSLRVYKDLSSAFLFLQDHADLDVNLLLLCCWLGQNGRVLNEEKFTKLTEQVTPCRDNLINPLRQARKFIKMLDQTTVLEELKNKILVCELEAERFEQVILLDTMNGFDDNYLEYSNCEIRNTVSNLKSYLVFKGVEIEGEIKTALTKVIETICQKKENSIAPNYWT